jgi:hypothetical protein
MDVRIRDEVRASIPQLGVASEQSDPMVWVKLSSEALGATWYVIEVQWLAIDVIFYGYSVGWDERRRSEVPARSGRCNTLCSRGA